MDRSLLKLKKELNLYSTSHRTAITFYKECNTLSGNVADNFSAVRLHISFVESVYSTPAGSQDNPISPIIFPSKWFSTHSHEHLSDSSSYLYIRDNLHYPFYLPTHTPCVCGRKPEQPEETQAHKKFVHPLHRTEGWGLNLRCWLCEAADLLVVAQWRIWSNNQQSNQLFQWCWLRIPWKFLYSSSKYTLESIWKQGRTLPQHIIWITAPPMV